MKKTTLLIVFIFFTVNLSFAQTISFSFGSGNYECTGPGTDIFSDISTTWDLGGAGEYTVTMDGGYGWDWSVHPGSYDLIEGDGYGYENGYFTLVENITVTFANGSSFTPSVTAGSSDQAIGRFQLTGASSGASLTGASIKLNGTRTGMSNIKLWSSANATFESGSDANIGSTVSSDPEDGSSASFGSFSSAIATGGIYYFVTCDLSSGATGVVQGVIVQNSSLTISSGSLSGTISNAPLSNGDATLPVTLSSFTAQYLNDTPTLCWTTQSETSNAGWNIYRGENEEALSNEEAYLLNLSLGLIPGAGSTSEPTDYSFEDFFPIYQGTTYFYWLESVDYSGESENYGPISLTIPAEEWQNPNSPEIPKPYGLHQNYPNPFNPHTEISFMLKESCIGELSIYNIKGQKIKTIFSNKSIPRDEMMIYIWNGKDEFGKEVSTGVYYYKLRTTKGNFVRKMILMK